jgi:hypothetical protein
MKIAELFRRLAFGELSNLSINNGDGTLSEEKHPQIVQYTNEGLLRIFSRFVLKEKLLLLEQREQITNYHLKLQFSEASGSDEPYPYIKDLPGDPFKGDVIKILSVYDEYGRLRVLNDQSDGNSFFTPQPDTLQIPNPEEGRPLSVTYQARHWVLDDRPGHIINQIIEVPFSLEGALQNFIGYKTYCHMNGEENIVKGQEYLAAYEAICVDIEQRDLVNQSFHTSHQKLEQRGFV